MKAPTFRRLIPVPSEGSPSDTLSFEVHIPGQKVIVKAEARRRRQRALGFENTYTLRTVGNPSSCPLSLILSVT
jgi:hypothetical protein